MTHNKASLYVGVVMGVIFTLLLLTVIGLLLAIFLSDKDKDSISTPIFPPSSLVVANTTIKGASHLKVPSGSDSSASFGVWHLLPHALVDDSIKNKNFDYSESLSRSHFPVVIYFHSVDGNRFKFIDTYNVLRKFFQVIAFDYESYYEDAPNEEKIIQDSVQLYKWLSERTDTDVYFWGHELGAALSTITIAKLREEDVVPTGLFLEAPFTTLREQIQELEFYKHLQWVPWFEAHIFEHLEKNGFTLNTTKHLLSVDCPVMIVHAKDDRITPYSFSEKLYNVAYENQEIIGGSVTLHLLPEDFHYGHFFIGKAPELPQYIQNHINICNIYWCTLQEGAKINKDGLTYSSGISSTCAQYMLNLLSED